MPSAAGSAAPLILVTGATGYVGGRLVPRLLASGYRVRCLVRDPSRLDGRPWRAAVEVARGDLLASGDLASSLAGARAAFYLVHAMAGGADFHERDLEAARRFGSAAREAGLSRIVYLGGLGPADDDTLSHHLSSRQKTGAALRESAVPVLELRASVIVGSGSLSFELIRTLTERLPVMICPRWVFTRTQPIGIRDVLDYLVASLEVPVGGGRTVEVGGADVVTYGDMMKVYAEVRGLRRLLLPVPVLTPRLSSWWVDVVTPVPAAVARPLIEGLTSETVVRDPSARELYPGIRPSDYRTAVERALARSEQEDVETAWSDALITSGVPVRPVLRTETAGMFVERRQRDVAAPAEDVFAVVTGIGGTRGWLYLNWTWRARGALDRMLGGVGLRRGRRDPDRLRVGDALDFWRVEAMEPPSLLRLRAEMKVPGEAWLQFQAGPASPGASTLVQTAYFAPKGLSGLLYWYVLYPFHRPIFSGLIDQIVRRSEARSQARGRPGRPGEDGGPAGATS